MVNKLSLVENFDKIPFVADFNVGSEPSWVAILKREGIEKYLRLFDKKLFNSRVFDFISNNKFIVDGRKVVPHLDLMLDIPKLSVDAYTIILVNGIYVPEISDEDNIPFSIFSDGLKVCISEDPDFLVDKICVGDNIFSCLNTAYLNDGVVIDVKPNENLLKPIHIISINLGSGNDANLFLNPRILINVGAGSNVCIVESIVSLAGIKFFDNRVCSINMRDGAKLRHVIYSDMSSQACVVENYNINVCDNAEYKRFQYVKDVGILFQNLNIDIEKSATVIVNENFNAGGDCNNDIHVNVLHKGSGSKSHIKLAAGADDNSVVKFKTEVNVYKNLDEIKADQESVIKLFSDSAMGEIQPVQYVCSPNIDMYHGAVVGGVGDDEIFFLNSRGIDNQVALHLIKCALLCDGVGVIDNDELSVEMLAIIIGILTS